jgi:hypothetical protein
MKKLLAIWILLTLNRVLFAAACCSSGGGNSLIITSDDRFQVQSIVSNKSLAFQTAYLISDLFQGSLSFPILYNANLVGLGDPSLAITYEVLPEYTYSRFRPRIFAFMGASVPLGNKSFDSLVKSNFEFTGGLFIMKEYNFFDYALTLEAKKLLDTTFTVVTDTYLVQSGLQYSAVLNVGFTLDRFRLGFSGGFLHEGEIKKIGAIESQTPSVFSTTYGVNLGLLLSTELSSLFALTQSKNLTQLSLALRYRFPK